MKKKIIYNEKTKKKYLRKKNLMGYCPDCIVREEINLYCKRVCIAGNKVVRLYCKVSVLA